MKFLPLLAALALISPLAACGRSSPVANADADLPDSAVGDAPGKNPDIPASAAAAERARVAAAPLPTDGMDWRWDAAAHAARFGIVPDGTSFSIACDRGRLVLRRFDPAPLGNAGTMSFTGNGQVASLPARTVAERTMSSVWEAVEAPSDRTQAVARVFDGPAPVQIALPGAVLLVTKPSPLPGRALAACGPAARVVSS